MSSTRSHSVLWSAALTVVAFFCAWGFAFHGQASRIATPVFSSSAPTTTSALVIMGEADVTSTESFVDEETSSSTHEEILIVQPTTTMATTTVRGLARPAMAYLKRVAGDPKPRSGERVIRVPVFMYHHIRAIRANDTPRTLSFVVTPESLEAQLKDLVQRGFHTITPDELDAALTNGAPLPDKPVLLTFDDGLREHYTVVLPLLKKYQVKATFFIITSANHLNGYLKDAMIKEMDESGLATIASHTEHHPYLARMSAATRVAEIVGSKRSLEALLGHPVNSFAYPYGSWDQRVAKEVEAAGYTLGFGVRLGSRHMNSSRYQLRRIRVQQGERISDLAAEL